MALALGSITPLSAQATAPDPADDIRPPKEMVVIPKTFREKLEEQKSTIFLWSGITAGAILLLVLLALWMKHQNRRKADGPARTALRSLADLQSSQDAMGAEAFAYLAAKTVRQYIADRFGIEAPRRTTEEFLRDLVKQGDRSPLAGESEHLHSFLKSCDLAKFAAANLDSIQRINLLDGARIFIRATAVDSARKNGGPA